MFFSAAGVGAATATTTVTTDEEMAAAVPSSAAAADDEDDQKSAAPAGTPHDSSEPCKPPTRAEDRSAILASFFDKQVSATALSHSYSSFL